MGVDSGTKEPASWQTSPHTHNQGIIQRPPHGQPPPGTYTSGTGTAPMTIFPKSRFLGLTSITGEKILVQASQIEAVVEKNGPGCNLVMVGDSADEQPFQVMESVHDIAELLFVEEPISF